MEKGESIVLMQADNGIIVRQDHGYHEQGAVATNGMLVFNDMKDLKVFIGQHFIDAEAAKKLKAAKKHTEK